MKPLLLLLSVREHFKFFFFWIHSFKYLCIFLFYRITIHMKPCKDIKIKFMLGNESKHSFLSSWFQEWIQNLLSTLLVCVKHWEMVWYLSMKNYLSSLWMHLNHIRLCLGKICTIHYIFYLSKHHLDYLIRKANNKVNGQEVFLFGFFLKGWQIYFILCCYTQRKPGWHQWGLAQRIAGIQMQVCLVWYLQPRWETEQFLIQK